MSRQKPQTEEFQPLSGVNIIPVIDVSLVLLIILLATSPMLNVPGFEVKLPKARTSENKEKNITVSLSLKDDLAINEQKANTFEEVGALIAKELARKDTPKDTIVIIRADEGVQYGKVENLMEIAKKAGAQRVAIATQQEEERGTPQP